MNAIVKLAVSTLALLGLCSCATVAPPIPHDVTLNDDAGRGGLLIVRLNVEGHGELPFVLDTGSPVTLLDQSLEQRLGKRLGTSVLHHFGDKLQSHIYSAPKLYLNGTRLVTGSRVWTGDFKLLPSGQPTMGIIGMDCLKHYRLQLDCANRKLRFLSPDDRLDAEQLGKRYPVSFSFPRCSPFINQRGLGGQDEQRLLVDTGYSADGASMDGRFEPALTGADFQEKGGGEQDADYTSIAECGWDAANYTNLLIGRGGNLIGLRFLARHLVTLDFPQRSLYLKQTSSGPLEGDRFVETQATAKAAADSAEDFLQGLKRAGRLLGWTKDEKGTSHATLRFCYFQAYPIAATFDIQKNPSAVYHYALRQEAKDAPWVLQKAWQTDENGRVIETFDIR